MTTNSYLMDGSSKRFNKLLVVFTGTDPEYSVEDYLKAVTVNLILNTGQNICTSTSKIGFTDALIKATLYGAAQKWFSVLPIEIKLIRKDLHESFKNVRL